jgi:threonine dehydrogenase-like Zn-dependent dehydrogenase
VQVDPGRGRARAFWLAEPGRGEIRPVDLPDPGPDDVLVRAVATGVSRGTETLVFRGQVPPSQYAAMRAPFQDGTFPAPVKYGYLAVGVVEEGPADLRGRTVFCLHPHQDRWVVPASAAVPVPDGVPPERAVLAGTVETAVNALWDAAPRVGDRIAVIGAGMVGGAVAAVVAGLPGARVQLVDVNPRRAALADSLGVSFASPDGAEADCDLVVHASATSAGLARGLELLGEEGELVELSWYGDREVAVPLGEGFHSRRLTIRGSQVSRVAPARGVRRGYADRMAVALDLLADPRFDALLTGRSRFTDLPAVLPRLASGEMDAVCHLITYDEQ